MYTYGKAYIYKKVCRYEIYIYGQRERAIESDRVIDFTLYIYTYIYIYREREREREK